MTRQPQTSPTGAPAGRPRRRGVTAMEYLFVISLILVVAIAGIGYFGQTVKGSADKTNGAINKKGP